MAEKTREIVRVIKSISSKDEATTGQAIGAIAESEKNTLVETLHRIDNAALKKEKNTKKSEEKASEEGRFLGRLVEKINSVHQETVLVRTR